MRYEAPFPTTKTELLIYVLLAPWQHQIRRRNKATASGQPLELHKLYFIFWVRSHH